MQKKEIERKDPNMEKTLEINGMMCPRCQARVEKTLSALEGVTSCTVDLAAKTATVTLSAPVSDETLFAAVKAQGYTPVRML